MKFKDYLAASPVEEGWLSDMFSKKSSLGPNMLQHGDKNKPATSYGSATRKKAMADKWKQMTSSGDEKKYYA